MDNRKDLKAEPGLNAEQDEDTGQEVGMYKECSDHGREAAWLTQYLDGGQSWSSNLYSTVFHIETCRNTVVICLFI